MVKKKKQAEPAVSLKQIVQQILEDRLSCMDIDYCRNIFVIEDICPICNSPIVCVYDVKSKTGCLCNFSHICLNPDCRHYNYMGIVVDPNNRHKNPVCGFCRRRVKPKKC